MSLEALRADAETLRSDVQAKVTELSRLRAEAAKWQEQFGRTGSALDQELRDKALAAVERQQVAIRNAEAAAAEAERAALRAELEQLRDGHVQDVARRDELLARAARAVDAFLAVIEEAEGLVRIAGKREHKRRNLMAMLGEDPTATRGFQVPVDLGKEMRRITDKPVRVTRLAAVMI